jgi:cytoskeletal protein RodZ
MALGCSCLEEEVTMNAWTTRVITLLLAFTLCGVTELANAMASPQAATSDQNQQSPPSEEQATAPKTDSQSTPTRAEDRADLRDSPGTAQSASQNQDNQNQSLQEPRGTAAARAAKTQGGAASKPAGAAIAPAKQRRTRSLLIKLGVIAGAGAALGTVYALAKGSPSRPPGAH